MNRPKPAAAPLQDIPGLRRALKRWYARHRRSLPWRRDRDPYRVLVSEFMLQQTQVATVLPYYEKFLRRFPSPGALAAAGEEEVRAAWSGLGYYRRAKNLRAAAARSAEEYDGGLPADYDALRELPGVGPYTAAALASIVHDLPHAVVDGNVVRVLTRLTADAGEVTSAAGKQRVQRLADQLLDPRAPGDWNQAVMELGATVCTPRSPRCGECPWSRACAAAAAKSPEAFPHKPPARKPVKVAYAVGVICRGDHALLVRRKDEGLLDGTWELPGAEVPSGDAPRDALLAGLTALSLGRAQVGEELAQVKHSITHRRLLIRAFAVRPARAPRARRDHRRWASPGDLDDLPLSSMTTKVLRRVWSG